MSLVSRIQDLAGAIAAWVEKLRAVKVVIVLGDGVNNLTTGTKLRIPDLPAGVLTGWTMMADASGSVVIDLKKATYTGWPTTTSITASAKPTLSTAQKNTAATLTGWTTTITAGDALDVVIDSVTGLKQVTLVLRFKRT